jgi:hypothetical protein
MSRNWCKLFAPRTSKSKKAVRGSVRPQVEALEPRLVPSQLFEAETAVLGGTGPYFDGGAINNYPRVEDVHTSGYTGYTGTGYVNLAYSDDSTITWDNVTEDQAGDYTLAFRYSMNTYYTGIWVPARPMGLMVNGNVITNALDFEATGNTDQLAIRHQRQSGADRHQHYFRDAGHLRLGHRHTRHSRSGKRVFQRRLRHSADVAAAPRRSSQCG